MAQKMADSLTRDALTARESDVLHLLALGHCNKSIARDLAITVGTVKGHLRAIFSKLQASSRTEAVGIAARRGLVDAPNRHGSARERPAPLTPSTGSLLTGTSLPARLPMSAAHTQRPARP